MKMFNRIRNKTKPFRRRFWQQVYCQFPLIPETNTNGWIYGAITEFIDRNGCKDGDAYIQSPGKRRAGLVWDIGDGKIEMITPPDKKRWGIYQVYFPRVIYNIDDLVFNFRYILPQLQEIYYELYPKEADII
jgi:hypothetical protein